MSNNHIQRLPAEQLFQREIDALIANEKYPVPTGWHMSPKSVLTYICGGESGDVRSGICGGDHPQVHRP